MNYCVSRAETRRRKTIEVRVGSVGVGANNPVRLQSMTTSDTQDVRATVQQCIALAEVGCEIVRVTAPNVTAARCLADIRRDFSAAGFPAIPLVADIHFLPSAAMEAVEHVEKIRVNPGNYADKKKFAVREYSEADYDAELGRLHEAFSPLVVRCRQLGRAMRIGTNHGSLSDRIMNRYGDTPLGMVESALEFLRIAQSHSYDQIVLSMKASNPKVMIEAYRLLVARMGEEDMHYPLHLGVTEAGDGEDGRIKSAIGIGSLLLDGLGDTIRVSLTEDSVYEVPVARAIADKAMSLWSPNAGIAPLSVIEDIDPYHFARRVPARVRLTTGLETGGDLVPRVFVRLPTHSDLAPALASLGEIRFADTPVEGLILPVASEQDLQETSAAVARSRREDVLFILQLGENFAAGNWPAAATFTGKNIALLPPRTTSGDLVKSWAELCARKGFVFVLDTSPAVLREIAFTLRQFPNLGVLVTFSGAEKNSPSAHVLGDYRRLAAALHDLGLSYPLWIRNTAETAVRGDNSFLSKLLESSFLSGALLCDGLGDCLSIETEPDFYRATRLSYNVLQGAGARISKTEFVACPSCGRTLFDLQSTTQRIREKTGHLKGVKIAIMGCIVNGPGEMADADFGYVGGAPGKINLYVGKKCVEYNIPQNEADAKLVALIQEHGKWFEPVLVAP